LEHMKQRWKDHLWSRRNIIQFTGRWCRNKYL
jgi:hypothetical protein